MNRTKQIGFLLGPLLFILILFFFKPEGLSPQARAVLASTAWIAVWWITEAIPIAVTALLPIVLFHFLADWIWVRPRVHLDINMCFYTWVVSSSPLPLKNGIYIGGLL
jgi:di/tricarboxylate transporter